MIFHLFRLFPSFFGCYYGALWDLQCRSEHGINMYQHVSTIVRAIPILIYHTHHPIMQESCVCDHCYVCLCSSMPEDTHIHARTYIYIYSIHTCTCIDIIYMVFIYPHLHDLHGVHISINLFIYLLVNKSSKLNYQ
jgi:hypothetical protein